MGKTRRRGQKKDGSKENDIVKRLTEKQRDKEKEKWEIRSGRENGEWE